MPRTEKLNLSFENMQNNGMKPVCLRVFAMKIE